MLDRRKISALTSDLTAGALAASKLGLLSSPGNAAWANDKIIITETYGPELILHVLAVIPSGSKKAMGCILREAAMREHGYYDYCAREIEGFTLAHVSVYGLRSEADLDKEYDIMASRLEHMLEEAAAADTKGEGTRHP